MIVKSVLRMVGMGLAILLLALLMTGIRGAPVFAATVTLTVVGIPATGPWGVLGTVADTRDVMADVMLDGVLHHTEHNAPYGFPDDNGTTATTAIFGNGSHTVQFIFKLEGTVTEIGRASVTVVEGSPQIVPGKVLGLSFLLQTVVTAQLSWNANTEPDLAGYKMFVGRASRIYDPPTNVPVSPTIATISGLVSGQTYYFALKAFDTANNESNFSSEVTKTIP